MLARSVVVVCACFSWACQSTDAAPAAGDAGVQQRHDARDAGPNAALPANVDAVLEARCRKCHSDPPANFAPFPLVTWQDTHAPAPAHEHELVYEVIAARIHDPGFPMPPAGNELTDADRKVLDDWIAGGAPAAQ